MNYLIIRHVFLGIVIAFLLVSLISLIIERCRMVSNDKKNEPLNLIEGDCLELFSFNAIQSKSDLLKKNSGNNPCLRKDSIHYVEYCDTVCNFKGGEKN